MSAGAPLDPRLTPYREDLAAAHLRGQVEAPRFAEGKSYRLTASHLPIRHEPRNDAPLETEALFGETVTLYDEKDGWGWGQLATDGYVGYLPLEGLSESTAEPTHRVAVLRTYVYPAPDIKTPPLAQLSIDALVRSEEVEGPFLKLAGGGYLFARHARTLGTHAQDFVSVAESFLGTPYLWGGRTSLGLDCSGLVQLSLIASGIEALRDTDMQRDSLGEPVEDEGDLRRGDLVFWPGHVGIMRSTITLLHANAHHMAVSLEPLEDARERIASEGASEMVVRRLPALAASAD